MTTTVSTNTRRTTDDCYSLHRFYSYGGAAVAVTLLSPAQKAHSLGPVLSSLEKPHTPKFPKLVNGLKRTRSNHFVPFYRQLRQVRTKACL